jgi:hypothetical protein
MYYLWYRVHGLPTMDEAKQPEPLESEPKESTASRIERREAEIALAMKEEVERRAAVIKNMHRLRALRMAQTPKASAPIPPAEARRVSKRSA